jgi:tetratricopeptide (TPR) repeat protein
VDEVDNFFGACIMCAGLKSFLRGFGRRSSCHSSEPNLLENPRAISKVKSILVTKSAKIAIAFASVLCSALLVIVSVVAVGIYYAVQYQKGKQLYGEGYRAEDHGDYDVAIAKLTEALGHKLTKNDRAKAYSTRGAAYHSTRKFDEAIRDFSHAIRLYPEWSQAHFSRGWSYQCKGEPDKAIQDFTEAIRHDQNAGWAYYDRGLLYLRRQQWDPAIGDFTEASRCLPKDIDPLLARGQAYLGKKELDRALASFAGAIAVDSFSPLAFLYRSNVYFTMGESDKQLHDYREAERLSSLDPKNRLDRPSFVPQSYHNIYRQLQEVHAKGDLDGTIELANQLISKELNWRYASPVLMDRGSAFYAKGEPDRAMIDYDQSIAFDPRNAGAHVNRALAWEKKGRRDEALRDYAEAIRLDPKMWQARYNRAISYREEGKFGQAIEDLTEVINLKPEYAPAYVNRAGNYYRHGEIGKAFNDWNRATEVDSKLVEAYRGRTLAYLETRDYANAAREIEKTTRLESKHLENTFNSLAWLQATCPDKHARNGAAAVQAATKACELTEWKNAAYIDTLAAAYAESGDFDQALKFQKRSLEMTGASATHRKGTEERLQLYQQRKPYREKPQN